MKDVERNAARNLRSEGYSINEIARQLKVAKSSVSVWVREIKLTTDQNETLRDHAFTTQAIEKRRYARLTNETAKRDRVIFIAKQEVSHISKRELWLMGVILYWAEGGKTQRIVRFSNGDPKMIIIMMDFFRKVCGIPESKFRGYIHIHPHLDYIAAEKYWSAISDIPLNQFFKTYRKQNVSSQNKKNTLPNGVMDIYVMDTKLFLKISGWAQGIFENAKESSL